jgi:hypothetical protein
MYCHLHYTNNDTLYINCCTFKETYMKKLLAVLIAGAFATSAFAVEASAPEAAAAVKPAASKAHKKSHKKSHKKAASHTAAAPKAEASK